MFRGYLVVVVPAIVDQRANCKIDTTILYIPQSTILTRNENSTSTYVKKHPSKIMQNPPSRQAKHATEKNSKNSYYFLLWIPDPLHKTRLLNGVCLTSTPSPELYLRKSHHNPNTTGTLN